MKYNGLTDKQEELIFMLMEECGEVIQACGKLLRHGPTETHPAGHKGTNKVELSRELGDLMGVVQAMRKMRQPLVYDHVIEDYADKKMDKARPYLHHYQESD